MQDSKIDELLKYVKLAKSYNKVLCGDRPIGRAGIDYRATLLSIKKLCDSERALCATHGRLAREAKKSKKAEKKEAKAKPEKVKPEKVKPIPVIDEDSCEADASDDSLVLSDGDSCPEVPPKLVRSSGRKKKRDCC